MSELLMQVHQCSAASFVGGLAGRYLPSLLLRLNTLGDSRTRGQSAASAAAQLLRIVAGLAG